MSHFVLGFTDGLAPMGAWAAIRNPLFSAQDLAAWILFAVVTFWIAGFDVIYACLDIGFDRKEGLQSIPARFGTHTALQLSSLSHALTVVFLVALGRVTGFAWPFWIGLMATIGFLIWEHSLGQPDDLSKLRFAFFNINGYISITLFLAILGALYIT